MKILFLGRVADALGMRQIDLALPADIADVEALRCLLGNDYPALLDPTVRVIVNDAVALGSQPVAADDEVAFFPPVSGG
jgi:molybdopterin converting factor subunit 1